jgi:hypothetical protein
MCGVAGSNPARNARHGPTALSTQGQRRLSSPRTVPNTQETTKRGYYRMMNARGLADEFDSIGREASKIADRLANMTDWRTEFEAMVIDSTESNSAFRSAVLRAGTELAVCQGKARMLIEELELASKQYREVSKL